MATAMAQLRSLFLIWNFACGCNDDTSVDANLTIGDVQPDAMQGHIHAPSPNNNWAYQRGSNGQGTLAAGSADYDRSTFTIGPPISDGINGTPRTASETRPRNVSLLATIRYSAKGA